MFLRMRQEGQTSDAIGFRFFADNALHFAHPETLTRVSAKFRIVQASTGSHCAANTTNTTELNAAEIFWRVFNDGSSTGAGDQTGDHQVNLRAFRRANSLDPPGFFRVQAGVCRCPNETCQISGGPHCAGTDDFAAVVVGTKFILQVIHDPDGVSDAKFLVSVVGQADRTFGYPSTTPPGLEQNPAVVPNAVVHAAGFAANCPINSGGPKEIDVQTQILPKIRTNPEAVIP